VGIVGYSAERERGHDQLRVMRNLRGQTGPTMLPTGPSLGACIGQIRLPPAISRGHESW
jgi:hypothetical protein